FLNNKPFSERKKLLRTFFTTMEHPMEVDQNKVISYVPAHMDPKRIWNIVTENKAEGVIAKRSESMYHAEKKHRDWYKVKNWRQMDGFLTFYDVDNGYYTVHVYKNGTIHPAGKCKHGLDAEEKETLKTLFTTKG